MQKCDHNLKLKNLINEFQLLSKECLKFRRALMVIRDNPDIDARIKAKEALNAEK